jgi:hypothetical protein
MITILAARHKLILEILFFVGSLSPILIFYSNPPITYVCLLFMVMGLVLGLLLLENVDALCLIDLS